ncbi:MAG: gamma carbonic anhydrase family protein [Bacteroidota bacterium]|nr:gamma carbonic anhydrase family protein [Bacteroidota bacterium]MDP4234428.1 gamma carbonic anhydrase family protein [Bacteroidota bacterium]MDP4243994.1 gamma carbonic anhydrase family protein [Bacteroidota bacterium]MDP4288160.1 gamma carbonic anhydrase family protein [Bacteroidota bacterium]
MHQEIEITPSVETGKLYAFDGRIPKVHESVFLAAGARIIGGVELEENVSVWFNSVIRGDIERVHIGRNSNVQDNVTIHVTHYTNPVWVGENVTIGHGAVLHGCTVKDGALIGMNAVVLDRVVIGEGSLVAAGSVVLGGTIVPPGMLVAGVPARILRPLSDEEKQMPATGFSNYLLYVKHYREELPPVDWDTGAFA